MAILLHMNTLKPTHYSLALLYRSNTSIAYIWSWFQPSTSKCRLQYQWHTELLLTLTSKPSLQIPWKLAHVERSIVLHLTVPSMIPEQLKFANISTQHGSSFLTSSPKSTLISTVQPHPPCTCNIELGYYAGWWFMHVSTIGKRPIGW